MAAAAKAKTRHFLLLLLGLGWMGAKNAMVLVNITMGTGHSNSRMYAYEYMSINTDADDDNKKRNKKNGNKRCIVPILKDYDEKHVSSFMQRLNILLPVVSPPPPTDNDSHANRAGNASNSNTTAHTRRPSCRLFVEEIVDIERQLLQFRIPRPVTVQIPDREYVSIQFWRWLFADQQKSIGQQRCPRCKLHFEPWADGQDHSNLSRERSNMFLRNKLQPTETADAILDMACPHHLSPGISRAIVNRSSQVLIGGCGESQGGSGSPYYKQGRSHFDYNAGFFDMGDGSPFQTTYAHLHLSPDGRFGFQELWNVTDVARQMLSRRIGLNNRTSQYSAVFIHNDCGGRSERGGLVKAAIEQSNGTTIARYGKCFHNVERPEWLAMYDGPPCSKRAKEHFFHGDCEATRDGTKTILSGLHDFTFALENTLSQDYFTEKRWEVLLAGSVPIVWDNHNSLDSLPDPDSALLVRTADGKSLKEKAQQLAALLQYYHQNRTAYQEFFRWKERGLSQSFLRKLFLSNDYLICPICEFVAQRKARNF